MLKRTVVGPVAAIGVMVMALSLVPLPGWAAPGESSVPADNPDLQKACGLDVLMVLDESGSIASSNATDDVRNAFRAFVASLKNTGSRMSVVEFSTVARLPAIAGTPAGTYVTIDDFTEPSFLSYINGFNPSGYTNWEDALRVGRFFGPRPDPNLPHLVVFLTDGDPTAVIDNSRVTHDPGNPNIAQNEYELKVPLAESETARVNENAGVTPARQLQRPESGRITHPGARGRSRPAEPVLGRPPDQDLRAGRVRRDGCVRHRHRRCVPRRELRRVGGCAA